MYLLATKRVQELHEFDASYYNLDLLSVCLSGISSAVYGPIGTKLGMTAEKAIFMSVCAGESQLGTPLAVR